MLQSVILLTARPLQPAISMTCLTLTVLVHQLHMLLSVLCNSGIISPGANVVKLSPVGIFW